jgi:hypothetical protein
MRTVGGWWIAIAAGLVACGGGASPPAASPSEAPPPAPPVAAPAAAPAPVGDAGGSATSRSGAALSRSAVRSVVAAGLGAFLQRIEFEDRPVFVGGRFHGFRVAALHDPAFFRGVDLRAGDVITGVNGFSIERPEQAASVFDSLQVASELRVTYERDGQPRALVYSIVDDR